MASSLFQGLGLCNPDFTGTTRFASSSESNKKTGEVFQFGDGSAADKAPSLKRDNCLDIWFKDEETDRYVKPKLKKFRQELPIFQRRQLITSLTENNKVILIKGETGCGKVCEIKRN